MAPTNFILTVAGVSGVVLLLRNDVKQSATIFRRNIRQIRHWIEEESVSASKVRVNENAILFRGLPDPPEVLPSIVKSLMAAIYYDSNMSLPVVAKVFRRLLTYSSPSILQKNGCLGLSVVAGKGINCF